MRPIRASEIGAFLYCERAWWYRIQGKPSENQSELAGGRFFHAQHGRKVFAFGLLRLIGWGLLLAAIVFLAVTLTLQFYR